MADPKPQSIDEYIAGFPPEVQQALTAIRDLIRRQVPDATETISYGMPTFNRNGSYLIYFAGWKKHIALYPVSGQMAAGLRDELAGFSGTKGSVHFPLGKPMPLELIKRIIEWRIAENDLQAAKS
nr:DUF1801 domain-containing protein [uncultured Dyadobacter sp.]